MPRDNKKDPIWRKKRARASREPPLPIPVTSMDSLLPSGQAWYSYTGYLQGSTVVVKHSGDMDFLYRMGFFGKGTLSRSEPNYEVRSQKVNIPKPNQNGSAESENRDTSISPLHLVLASKRRYLKHLQYRALEEDDESGYNELLEQETMQRYKNGEEEEEEDEEEEEEEEDESYESDDSNLGRFSQGRQPRPGNQSFLSMIGHSGSVLYSLLAEVARLSKENIATFVRVPQTLYQLEVKFAKVRQQEVQSKALRASSIIPKSKSQNIIDLRESEGDDVVILNSDDDNSDTFEDEEEKGGESYEKDSKIAAGWNDPTDKGDTSFWSLDSSLKDNTAVPIKGRENLGSHMSMLGQHLIPNEKNSLSKGNESKVEEGKAMTKPEDNSPTVKEVQGKGKKEEESMSVLGKNEAKVNDTDILEGQDFSKGKILEKNEKDLPGFSNDESQEKQSSQEKSMSEEMEISETTDSVEEKGKGNFSVLEISDIESKPKSESSQINSNNLPAMSSPKGVDSDDSDDVICVESESAKPEKLHNFLAQPHPSKHTSSQSPLVFKTVRFMTNVAKEPKFVNAKIGFQTWDNILHFNFSGDETHLPTALAILPDRDNSHPQDVLAGNFGSTAYERVFPPVKSLVAHSDSKGAVIKQRLEDIPCLEIAKRNVLSSTSSAIHHSLSDNSHVPFSSTKLPLTKHSKQTFQNTAFHSESSSLYQNSDLLKSEAKEASSLNSSHLAQYICVFHRENPGMSSNTHESSISTEKQGKCENVGEFLISIHSEIDKLREDSSISDQDGKKEELENRDKQMLNLNRLVSEYLNKIGISIIKELVLLKLLVCGSQINSQIEEEDVVKTKTLLTPEDKSFLLERLDFVQSCLTPHSSSYSAATAVKLDNSDVIMIDLSDEESSSNDKREVKGQKKQATTSLTATGLHPHGVRGIPQSNANKDESLVKHLSKKSLEKSNGTIKGSPGADEQAKLADESALSSGRKRSRDKEDDDSKQSSKVPKLDESDESKVLEKNESKLFNVLNGSYGSQESNSLTNQENQVDPAAKLNIENDENFGSDLHASAVKFVDGSNSLKEDSVSMNNELSSGLADPHEESTLEKHPDCLKDQSKSHVPVSESEDSHKKSPHNSSSAAATETQALSENQSERLSESSVKDHTRMTDVPLEDNQIYVVSSDEEDSPLKRRVDKSRFSGLRPQFYTMEHPYSIKDNFEGDTFVVPNTSDEEDEETSNTASERFLWQPCVKKDPYPATERLHLLLEEAFFLTFGLGCLTVLDPEKKPMTITEMWQQFPLLKDNFVPHYVAYHYFRSKGWVPKSGLKFGCDFVLYREGPPFFHGSYSVVIIAVKEGSLTPMIGDDGGLDYPQRLNTWITLSGLNRVTEHVAKELMFCYVICPRNLTEEEYKSPKCISQFRVKVRTKIRNI